MVVDSVRSFYEAWLGVPYGPPLVFLQHTITVFTLLLVALEEMAGVDWIRGLLAAMLREPDRTWNYAAFREAALAAGVSSETWSQFETQCVRPRFADGCLASYASR
jgi:hypothetical protein